MELCLYLYRPEVTRWGYAVNIAISSITSQSFNFSFAAASLLHRHVELRAEIEPVTKSWEITSGKSTIPGVLPNGISCYLIYGVVMYGTVKIFINLDNWAESREVSCGVSWNIRDTSPSWIQQFGGREGVGGVGGCIFFYRKRITYRGNRKNMKED